MFLTTWSSKWMMGKQKSRGGNSFYLDWFQLVFSVQVFTWPPPPHHHHPRVHFIRVLHHHHHHHAGVNLCSAFSLVREFRSNCSRITLFSRSLHDGDNAAHQQTLTQSLFTLQHQTALWHAHMKLHRWAVIAPTAFYENKITFSLFYCSFMNTPSQSRKHTHRRKQDAAL